MSSSPKCAHTFPLWNLPFTPQGTCFTADHPLLSPTLPVPSEFWAGTYFFLGSRQDSQGNHNPGSTSSHIQRFWAFFLFSLSLGFVLFCSVLFCFVLFFVSFILFIPSKLPEQLVMADKSGTFALFILTSNTEDVGRRNSEGESEAEGVEPGAPPGVWCLPSLGQTGPAGAPARPQSDPRAGFSPMGAQLTYCGPYRDSQPCS